MSMLALSLTTQLRYVMSFSYVHNYANLLSSLSALLCYCWQYEQQWHCLWQHQADTLLSSYLFIQHHWTSPPLFSSCPRPCNNRCHVHNYWNRQCWDSHHNLGIWSCSLSLTMSLETLLTLFQPYTHFASRFRPLANVLPTLSIFRLNVAFQHHLKFSCKAMCTGEPQTVCGMFVWATSGTFKWACVLWCVQSLSQAINLFISSADELFSPITTIHCPGFAIKNIPWMAFTLKPADWECVNTTHLIIADVNNLQHYFSYDTQPTLWWAIPAFKEILITWKAKCDRSL